MLKRVLKRKYAYIAPFINMLNSFFYSLLRVSESSSLPLTKRLAWH